MCNFGEKMAKRKHHKIDLSEIFGFKPDKTLIRPKSITINLENRGKDFKLEYKETFEGKRPPKDQEWSIETTLDALKQIKEDIGRHNKYFFYQSKPIKKGYEFMIVSDDAFALVAGLLAELLAFGVRHKEDSYNILPLIESVSKWISKANITDG